MNGVKPIAKAKEEAEADYKKYSDLVKKRKESYVEDLKKLNYHLKEGRKVLNIYDVFRAGPRDEEGRPKLAIGRADQKTVQFQERAQGGGRFTQKSSAWEVTKECVILPDGTFPVSMIENENGEEVPRENWRLRKWETAAPIVPADYLPEGSLSNYYVLWEVEEGAWKDAKIPPRDPFLLRRISPNMFVIFAEWDLTDLERAVLEGRL